MILSYSEPCFILTNVARMWKVTKISITCLKECARGMVMVNLELGSLYLQVSDACIVRCGSSLDIL